MPYPGGNIFINPNELIQKAGILAGMTVADLGCGSSGIFALPVAKIVGDGGHVYIVDVSKSALNTVMSLAKREGLANIEPAWSNLEIYGATPITPNSVDLAWLVNVLFQNKKQDSIIKEAARLLKSGGRLLVVDWLDVPTPVGPPTELRVDKENIKKIAAAAGLKLTSESSLGHYHFFLVFQK